jgi:hypothetical protein
MNIQIPRREPTAAPPGAPTRTRPGTPVGTQVDPQARFRRAKAHCGSCGEAWFGEVAYCPYCGIPSATAPVRTASTSSLVAEPDTLESTPRPVAGYLRSRAAETRVPARQRDMDWKRWAQPLALATVAAVFVFAAGQLAVTASRRAQPTTAVSAPAGDAERSDTSAAGVEAATPTTAVPRAVVEPPPQVRAPAPPQATKPVPRAQVAAPGPAPVTKPAPPAQAAAPAAPAKAAEPAPPAQVAEPAPQPARNRALCSPASEAAGLCKAQ